MSIVSSTFAIWVRQIETINVDIFLKILIANKKNMKFEHIL